MQATLTRILLFVNDVPKAAAFYRDVLGLTPVGSIETDWAELQAGGCCVALHRTGKAAARGGCATKLVFGARDVAAARDELIGKGVAMGKLHAFEGIEYCDGADPEGNRFQISSRGLR